MNEEQRMQDAMLKAQKFLLDNGILTRLEQDGTFIRITGVFEGNKINFIETNKPKKQ